MSEKDATHSAAGVAYYFLFSMFPLLLGTLAILGVVVDSEDIQAEFLVIAGDHLPGSAEFVEENLEQVVELRRTLGIGAIIALLWSGTAVFGAMSRAINRAWDVRVDRPFFIAKPQQLAMALGIGVMFLVSGYLITALQLLADPDLNVSGLVGFVIDAGLEVLVLWVVPWGMTFVVFLLLYRFIPNCKTYWRTVWPGAVVAAVMFEISKGLFVWYLKHWAIYDTIYGGLASALVLMVWAYVASFILILGAEISSKYDQLFRER